MASRFPACALALAATLLVPATAARADHDHAMPAASAAPAPAPAPLFDNLGHHHHAVTTNSRAAQRYFDQGLTLVYAFNHDEAIRSFKEAARLDPDCAMAWWGVALACGPNINLPMEPDRAQAADAAIARAKALAPKVSAEDRAYITALSLRYRPGDEDSRQELDETYAEAMRGLARSRPDDMDAQVLFAEALMDLRPWDLWTKDGRPQPGTEELMAVLENVLAKAPDHPGANHYYIHVMEASPHPEKALACAERLPGLVPGAGHIVHMPAHIYMRIGRYHDASAANQAAVEVDEAYIARAHPEGIYPVMYYTHNLHFLWASLAIEGRSAEALDAARRAAARVTPELARAMPMAEFIPPTPYYALVRFGRWREMLAEPAPPADLRFVRGMYFYARGMALANSGDVSGARAACDSVDAIAAGTARDFMVGVNPARALLRVAGATLGGEIERAAGRLPEAVAAFEQAVALEDDGLRYDEPPAWYQPTREFLGAALLAAGRPADAEGVYRADLERHVENGWALRGLADALAAEGRGDEAAAVGKRFDRAWAHADVKLAASRF